MASLYLNGDLHESAFTVGARLAVWGPEARHAKDVSRVRQGERIAIGDGSGRLAWGPVTFIGQGEVAITADEIVVDTPRRPEIRLVQALAKGDRDELAIQAATELGVASVIPWQAKRSISRWDGPKAAKGVERWRSVVREAAKQAIRPTVPSVGDPLDTRRLVDAAAALGLVLVLEPTGSECLVDVPLDGVELVTLVVGPEGGIDDSELVQLEAAGARIVRLGSEVLRTSTAGPAALAALSVMTRRWSGS